MQTEKLGAQKIQRSYTVSKTQNSSVNNMISSDKNDKGDQVSFSGKLSANSFMNKLRNSKLALAFAALTALGGGYLVNQNNMQQRQNELQQKEIAIQQRQNNLQQHEITLQKQEISAFQKTLDQNGQKMVEFSEALKLQNEAAGKFGIRQDSLTKGQQSLVNQINTDIAPYSLKKLEELAKKASPSITVFAVKYENKNGDTTGWSGSGFMIAPNLILTNAHILNTEESDVKEDVKRGYDDFRMVVKIPNMIYPVRLTKENIIALDTCYDLAVVKLPDGINLPASAKPLPLCGEKPVQGECVAAMGEPICFANSFSAGVISNTERYDTAEGKDATFVQTDAVINHGSSGGPLLNLKGEVVGVNSWGLFPAAQGLSFSIDIPSVKAFLLKHHIELEKTTESEEK